MWQCLHKFQIVGPLLFRPNVFHYEYTKKMKQEHCADDLTIRTGEERELGRLFVKVLWKNSINMRILYMDRENKSALKM